MTPTPLPETLITPDVVLRRNDPALAETIFAVVQAERERLGAWLPWVAHTRTVDDTLAYLGRTRLEWDDNRGFDYHVLSAADGAYWGNIGLHSVSWAHARAEIGYWLSARAEGRGAMRAAVRALEDAAFTLGFERLEIRCDPRNVRSLRVPEALGYMREGHLRQNQVEGGLRRDTLIFGKLRAEWAAAQVPG